MVYLSKFKVGDIVHAKKFGRFVITDRLKPCKVVDIEGDYIKIIPLCEGCKTPFTEYANAFELFPTSEMLVEGDILELTKTLFDGKHILINSGTSVVFKSYSRFGVIVTYLNKKFEVSLEDVKRLIKGLKI